MAKLTRRALFLVRRIGDRDRLASAPIQDRACPMAIPSSRKRLLGPPARSGAPALARAP
jgi:hypothetical protein